MQKGSQRGSPIQKLVAGGLDKEDEEDSKGDDGKSSDSKSSSSSGGSGRSGGGDRKAGLPEGACKNPHKDDKDDCEEYCDECEYYDCSWLDCPTKSTSKSSDVKTFIQKSKNLRRRHR